MLQNRSVKWTTFKPLKEFSKKNDILCYLLVLSLTSFVANFRLAWQILRTALVLQRTTKMHSVVHNKRLPSLYQQQHSKVSLFMSTQNLCLQALKVQRFPVLQFQNSTRHWLPFHDLLWQMCSSQTERQRKVSVGITMWNSKLTCILNVGDWMDLPFL